MPQTLRDRHPEQRIIAHDDVFPQDTDDEIWLREAGLNGWVVLTKDEKIRRKPGEQRAIADSGARCFCLHPTKGMQGEEMAEALSHALDRILQIAESEKRRGGFVKVVDRRGRIRHLFP